MSEWVEATEKMLRATQALHDEVCEFDEPVSSEVVDAYNRASEKMDELLGNNTPSVVCLPPYEA